MKNCPKCKLTNPDSAIRCDCGWDFENNSQEKSYIKETRNWQILPWYKRGFSLGIKLAGLGAAIGWFTAHPQVDPNSPLWLGILSEEKFIKVLMASVGSMILFSVGFLVGVVKNNKKPSSIH